MAFFLTPKDHCSNLCVRKDVFVWHHWWKPISLCLWTAWIIRYQTEPQSLFLCLRGFMLTHPWSTTLFFLLTRFMGRSLVILAAEEIEDSWCLTTGLDAHVVKFDPQCLMSRVYLPWKRFPAQMVRSRSHNLNPQAQTTSSWCRWRTATQTVCLIREKHEGTDHNK